MDIEAAYAEAGELARKILSGEQDWDDAERLAELFGDIDTWMRSKGFPPRAWERGHRG